MVCHLCTTLVPVLPFVVCKTHQLLRDAENDARVAEDYDSKESRRALLRVNAARARLALVLEKQVRCNKQLNSDHYQNVRRHMAQRVLAWRPQRCLLLSSLQNRAMHISESEGRTAM